MFDFIEGNKFAVYLFSSAPDSGDPMNSALFAMAFRVLKTVEAIFFVSHRNMAFITEKECF